ncbi:hypothetical protein [Hymenobacter guriensis]|uniref:Uncharacterized protein n=1 Tax=Hymenobacter guriensis TaxID=2793065 RepID=A0ABS0L7S4_9BACT|nr:hypothetical protein [Hymenobacter guriensis]MBG8556181.1 hypothetical protein [Hymenobacter guriensis]
MTEAKTLAERYADVETKVTSILANIDYFIEVASPSQRGEWEVLKEKGQQAWSQAQAAREKQKQAHGKAWEATATDGPHKPAQEAMQLLQESGQEDARTAALLIDFLGEYARMTIGYPSDPW